MKKLSALLLALLLCAVCPSAWAKSFQLKNELVKVAIDKDGNLTSLTNLKTGHNYASGGYLWRMFYDTHAEREIQIMPDMQKARVSCDGKAITIVYDKLTDIDGVKLDMELRLIVTLHRRWQTTPSTASSASWTIRFSTTPICQRTTL